MTDCANRRALPPRTAQGWRPPPAGPGTRIGGYRCSLPGLAGFATYRRGEPTGTTVEALRRENHRAPAACLRRARPRRHAAVTSCCEHWRRGRDSNPRYGDKPYTHFPGVLLQPLGHLSASGHRPHPRQAGACSTGLPAMHRGEKSTGTRGPRQTASCAARPQWRARDDTATRRIRDAASAFRRHPRSLRASRSAACP